LSTSDQNINTLRNLFENLGPGIERYMAIAQMAMTEDVVWQNLGFPVVNGLGELERFLQMFEKTMGFNANPILEWRNIYGFDIKFYSNASVALRISTARQL
jgi:limonene-1,2-epoxide hydrolase